MSISHLKKDIVNLALFSLLLSLIACQNVAMESEAKREAELIFIGTIHFPTARINADTLLHQLSLLKPD